MHAITDFLVREITYKLYSSWISFRLYPYKFLKILFSEKFTKF